jgi:para-nitrobenzyl esterase
MTMFLHDAPFLRDISHEAAEAIAPAFARNTTDLYPTYRRTRPTATPAQLLTAIGTDVIRVESIQLAERKVAAGSAPVWMYRCDVASSALGGALGAPHAIDVPLVFANVACPFLEGHPDAETVAATMLATWAYFARFGNPNHPSLPAWPAYALDERSTMLFNRASTVVHDPDSEERQAWPVLGNVVRHSP